MNPILKIVPPIWFFLLLIAGLMVHYFHPSIRYFDFSFPIVGVIVFILGFALPLYASALFSKEKTEILPTSSTNTKLIVYGPFKYTRNPMYLGMVVQLLGVAIFYGTLPLFVSTAVLFLVFNFAFIPFEEAKMSRIFGAEYESYRHTVRRWL